MSEHKKNWHNHLRKLHKDAHPDSTSMSEHNKFSALWKQIKKRYNSMRKHRIEIEDIEKNKGTSHKLTCFSQFKANHAQAAVWDNNKQINEKNTQPVTSNKRKTPPCDVESSQSKKKARVCHAQEIKGEIAKLEPNIKDIQEKQRLPLSSKKDMSDDSYAMEMLKTIK